MKISKKQLKEMIKEAIEEDQYREEESDDGRFELVAVWESGEEEVVDSVDNEEEAEYLQREYGMAYGNAASEIKIVDTEEEGRWWNDRTSSW